MKRFTLLLVLVAICVVTVAAIQFTGRPLSSMPEPETLLLVGVGLTALAAQLRRRFRKTS